MAQIAQDSSIHVNFLTLVALLSNSEIVETLLESDINISEELLARSLQSLIYPLLEAFPDFDDEYNSIVGKRTNLDPKQKSYAINYAVCGIVLKILLKRLGLNSNEIMQIDANRIKRETMGDAITAKSLKIKMDQYRQMFNQSFE